MLMNGGYAGGGEARARIRVSTAGEAASLLGSLDPGAPVSCLARDACDREVEGVGLVIETVSHDSGWQYAWLTVELPVAVPDVPGGHVAGGPLDEAWEEHEWAGDCPLAAVTALIARRDCSQDGCAAYGTRSCSCSAHGRYDGPGDCP